MATVTRDLSRLQEGLAACRDRLTEGGDAAVARVAPDVSAWTVGEQLWHVLHATALGLAAVQRILDEEEPDEGRPSLAWHTLMLVGRIPRGKGQAPSVVQPPEVVDRDKVARELAESASLLARIAGRVDELPDAAGRVEHRAFGWLDAVQWLRFLAIHLEHHLRLVAAIEKSAG